MRFKQTSKENRPNTLAFTLLEFIVAITLSSLLVILIYQTYSQFLESYRRERENSLENFYRLTETLKWQLQEMVCEEVPYRGKRPFFYFEEGLLAFLTRHGPGGTWLVAYGPAPDGENKYFYFEKPYFGEKIQENVKESLLEEENKLFYLQNLGLKLFKCNEGEEKEEITTFTRFEGETYCLLVEGTKGLRRKICFRGCF